MLLEFCSGVKMGVLNTHFKHKWAHRRSWLSADKRTERAYDLFVGGGWVRRNVRDVRVRNGVQVDSDHRAVVATFAFPRFKRDKRRERQK